MSSVRENLIDAVVCLVAFDEHHLGHLKGGHSLSISLFIRRPFFSKYSILLYVPSFFVIVFYPLHLVISLSMAFFNN
jgi:hypothetical protein